MGRTLRDYDIPGVSASAIRDQVRGRFAANNFRILDEASDGRTKTYDAPELLRDRGRTHGGHLRFASPLGSVVALNVAAGGGDTPTIFAVVLTESPVGVHIHGEFFGPTSIESFGGPLELKMINTIWTPAGIPRKRAYVLVSAFEKFVESLRSPLPSC